MRAPATAIAIRGPARLPSRPNRAVMTAMLVLVLTDQADRVRATRSGAICSRR